MLSSKARYALIAMAALARRYEAHANVPVDEIARSEKVPVKFLESILTQLAKSGLVISRRGPSGGFMLARDPHEIALAEVVRTLDGPFAPTPCARSRQPVKCETCEDMDACHIRPIMREVRDAMAQVLENRTIHDLVTNLSVVEGS